VLLISPLSQVADNLAHVSTSVHSHVIAGVPHGVVCEINDRVVLTDMSTRVFVSLLKNKTNLFCVHVVGQRGIHLWQLSYDT